MAGPSSLGPPSHEGIFHQCDVSQIEEERDLSETHASSSATGSDLVLDVNGESHSVSAPCSVAGLLEILELAGKRVAVAVNRDVVARSQYSDLSLASGDRIEILEAVGGG
jgi:sulfur carrier protein